MFGLSMSNCRSWSIENFREAVIFYESCPTPRGTEYGEERRILGKETSRQMGVRISQDSVKFRYHRTDVVTWNKDDSVTIKTFPSRSTCEFANRFLQNSTYLTKQGSAVLHRDRFNPVVGKITLYKSGEVDHGNTQAVFAKRRTCKKTARDVLASTRFSEYREWHKLMYSMIRENQNPSYYGLQASTYLEMLDSKDRWHDLMLSILGEPGQLRGVIYDEFYRRGVAVYYDEEVNYLPSGTNISTWRVFSK